MTESIRIKTPFGRDLVIEAQEDAIIRSSFVARSRRSAAVRPKVPLLREAHAQVRAYIAKRLIRFDLPLRFEGTPLTCEIFGLVSQLQVAEIVSYADVARALGRPFAHRAVAAAMGRSSHALFVPAHRVVGADGRIKGAEPNSMRRKLLKHEGVTIR